MYFFDLVEILEVPENFNNTAVRKIGTIKYFEFDINCQKSIERFLKDNHMEKTIYAVVGEDDSGFYTIIAVVDYTKGKVVLKAPTKELQEFYKNYAEGVEIPIACYIEDSDKVQVHKCYYGV